MLSTDKNPKPEIRETAIFAVVLSVIAAFMIWLLLVRDYSSWPPDIPTAESYRAK